MSKSPTVYAVEDDPVIRELLKHVFTLAKISMESYASADEFLKSYSPTNPGCILIDMNMPGMNGLELQRFLVSKGNNTPIIFLTGAATGQSTEAALKAGAVDFLAKPFVLGDLLNSVGMAIEMDLSNRYGNLQ